MHTIQVVSNVLRRVLGQRWTRKGLNGLTPNTNFEGSVKVSEKLSSNAQDDFSSVPGLTAP